jgi:phytoene dehydrogenase-like protein
MRFLRFALLPVRRLAEERFGGEGAAWLLAGNALHADLTPEANGSGLFGWVLCGLGQQHGFPTPEGGAGQLTAALVSRLRAHGGRLECGVRVERVLVRRGVAVGVRTEDGREITAGRAVLAGAVAPVLYEDLVGVEHLPPGLVSDLRRFQRDSSTVKVDWSLDGPIPWTAAEARRAGTIHVADGVDALTRTTAQLARGLVPDQPFLVMGQYSMVDETRQPPGKDTAWAYTHVPQRVKGDAAEEGLTGRWDEREAERFAERVEGEIERRAPGFRALVRARHIFTPPSLEAANSNLLGGGVNQGTAQIHQQLVFRPTPGLGRAETPIGNLFLTSASAHPGGGVHGAAGANAARAAMRPTRLVTGAVARVRAAGAAAPRRGSAGR